METISVISHKGGAGKTSTAVMLAEDLVSRGLRVVLIDADRQRGAGLLLGIEQPTGLVQQTSNPRMRYFCSASVPLRELPAKSEELAGLFDIAIVDTPSLDDPLARAWIQLSTSALTVMPVEPLSVKTLDRVGATVENVQRLNPRISPLGLLPTMFDETDSTQRTLMLELRARQPEGLLDVAVPYDAGLAHRAEQRLERRTEPSAATRAAYQAVGDRVVQGLLGESGSAPSPAASAPASASTERRAAREAAPPPVTTEVRPNGPQVVKRPPSRETSHPVPAGNLRWAVAAVVLILLAAGIGVVLRQRGQGSLPGTRGTQRVAAYYGAIAGSEPSVMALVRLGS